ncbi:MAG: hypothetical protein SFV81_21595 [Pirellulaceae bacterium]|nr:hypothetical protein [Pirellulaceae bacterium]
MARVARVEAFAPDEIATVHVMNRVVRRCFLMGTDDLTGKNYDHRKIWVENELKRLAAGFGIDLLSMAILSNHFHLILRSRPDVVATWDDTEVARRWLLLCPVRKSADGSAAEPSEPELNSIRFDADKVNTIRSRLSDISWWMRVLCQRIAQKANFEEEISGKFLGNRYKAVRLIDDEAILACAAYVDLNPIRAGIAQTIEDSQFTSARLRLQTTVGAVTDSVEGSVGSNDVVIGSALHSNNLPNPDSAQTPVDLGESARREQTSAPKSMSVFTEFNAALDSFLAPIEIDELSDPLGARASASNFRCSAKGFLAMPTAAYLELLDWTARQIVTGKRGATPEDAPLIFERLKIKPMVWYELVTRFGKLFSLVAGQPHRVDEFRGRLRKQRYHVRQAARELLST